MKSPPDERLNKYRVRQGPLGSNDNLGNTGALIVPGPLGFKLQTISSGTDEKNRWEHVSVSTYRKNRIPVWEEMCFVKDIFWDKEETVIQYHPPESEYINNHAFVLHLWRPLDFRIPLPPSGTVGIRGARVLGTDGKRVFFTMSKGAN